MVVRACGFHGWSSWLGTLSYVPWYTCTYRDITLLWYCNTTGTTGTIWYRTNSGTIGEHIPCMVPWYTCTRVRTYVRTYVRTMVRANGTYTCTRILKWYVLVHHPTCMYTPYWPCLEGTIISKTQALSQVQRDGMVRYIQVARVQI